MKLYGIKAPDGDLLSIQPQTDPYEAYLAASTDHDGMKWSAEDLKASPAYIAVCYRANGCSFGWRSYLAREIGVLMGYVCVEVVAREKP